MVYDLVNSGNKHRYTVVGNKCPFVVSNCTQGGGHDVLQIMLHIYDGLLRENNVLYTPIIWDFHDECLIEVKVGDTDKVLAIIDEMFLRVNKFLTNERSVIKFKGTPAVCKTLADAKLEE
jgi:hypothetical protein